MSEYIPVSSEGNFGFYDHKYFEENQRKRHEKNRNFPHGIRIPANFHTVVTVFPVYMVALDHHNGT